MACPCVVLVEGRDARRAAAAGQAARDEVLRIETKYSRYRDSLLTRINRSAGEAFEVDEETADLLDYAASCYQLSDRLFDITSGVLRRVWKFDGSDRVPSQSQVEEVLARVGWHQVEWRRPTLRLAPQMEIDFGGIGKEYAVDRALAAARAITDEPVLVNLGGDLRLSGPRRDGTPWRIAIEDAGHVGGTAGQLALENGALATSGDSHRYLLRDGVRYGHVLNPLTGWPVSAAPRSVTVHAGTCTEAGLLAKLALLSGAQAETFLREQEVRSWCLR
jgi:thiamine biosynthesis lipoprotein